MQKEEIERRPKGNPNILFWLRNCKSAKIKTGHFFFISRLAINSLGKSSFPVSKVKIKTSNIYIALKLRANLGKRESLSIVHSTCQNY